MSEHPERETWDYDMDEGGLAVKTPPPEERKPILPEAGIPVSPIKAALRRAKKETPHSFARVPVVDRTKAMVRAQAAQREGMRVQQETEAITARVQKLAATPQGHEGVVRRATVESIRKESTLGAVRREMATVTTPYEQQKGRERVQRAAMVKAATVESKRQEATLGAVRREMNTALAPKAQELDVPLLTELFNDAEESIPTIQPLKEVPQFQIEPEPTIHYTRSEEPKGLFARGWAKVKSWWGI